MKLALFFTFLSLALTAVNDLVFKCVSDRLKSRSGFMAVVGLVEFLSFLLLPWNLGAFAWRNAVLCLLSGVCSFVANIFLIASMRYLSAGVSSTIYRLNMVFVFIGSLVFLGESVSPWQWLGIVLAVVSVFLFSNASTGDNSNAMKGMTLGVIASLLRAVMGLLYKYTMNQDPTLHPNTLSLGTAIIWLVGGLVYCCKDGKDWSWVRDKSLYSYGILSGVLVTGIVYGMSHSMHLGSASIFLPIAQMSFVVTFVLEVLFMGERCTWRKLASLGGCIAAIVLLVCGGK